MSQVRDDSKRQHQCLLFNICLEDLEDLSVRIIAVKEENLKLKSENQVLGQYIENLMSAFSVFQTTYTKSKRK
ncbi:short coiled-coil protein B-like [Marmota marmota marmota]|uniref:short coiled-coil protein B-like n=1 Tax=Marmota marmota marmota TaxID=9994 RepID=UPI00209326C3|nr:short coiled-coil protein B-like [Marmota marmota marmota]